jgi:hypothetical protein
MEWYYNKKKFGAYKTYDHILCYIQKFCVSFQPLVLKKLNKLLIITMEIGDTYLKFSKRILYTVDNF